MRMATHPFTGVTKLEFDQLDVGEYTVSVSREARYSPRQKGYWVRTLFAKITAHRTPTLLFGHVGWVVSRSTFDELRAFDTLAEAKVYVESLFALESSE